MVSFVCDTCQETVKKPKLDQHFNRCHYAQFSCIDCSVSFQGVEYRSHTSCISEAEKYQKALYRGPKKVCTAFDTNICPYTMAGIGHAPIFSFFSF
jgi:cell growth-regulating nucleolar protein